MTHPAPVAQRKCRVFFGLWSRHCWHVTKRNLQGIHGKFVFIRHGDSLVECCYCGKTKETTNFDSY